MANPMPPPALATVAVAAVVPRSPNKKKTQTSRNSEPKESPETQDETPSSSSSTRSVTKTITKKVMSKSYKTSAGNDGLETGSDSDLNDDSTKKMYPNKWNNTKYEDRNSVETELKSVELRNKNLTTAKNEKYTVPPFNANISPIMPVREETTYKKDDLHVDNLLADYETPYLSEFTRRLSSRAPINAPSTTRSTLKSLYHQKFNFHFFSSFEESKRILAH